MNLQEVKSMLAIALANADNVVIPHEVTCVDLDDNVVKVTIPDTQGETAFIKQVFEAIHMIPVKRHAGFEVASSNSLEYTNDPAVFEAAHAEATDPEMDAALADDEDDTDEVTKDVENISAELNVEKPTPVAPPVVDAVAPRAEMARDSLSVSDESKLKILTNSDMLKTANKIYDMISPGDDKSNYAAFLYNFDDFILAHRPDQDYAEDGDDVEESDEAIDLPSSPVTELSSSTTLAYMENLYLEVAKGKKKGKNGRAKLLSVFMTGMSGEDGASATAAFESGDQDKLRAALIKIVDKVVGEIPAKQEAESEK